MSEPMPIDESMIPKEVVIRIQDSIREGTPVEVEADFGDGPKKTDIVFTELSGDTAVGHSYGDPDTMITLNVSGEAKYGTDAPEDVVETDGP